MEQMNEIKLRGTIGVAKPSCVFGNNVTEFTLATSYCYKDKNGYPVIETTWHNVIYWGDIELKKGDKVEVVGRLRNYKSFYGEDGQRRNSSEVIAKIVDKLELDEPLKMEEKKYKKCVFDVHFTPIVSVEYEVEDEKHLTNDEWEKIKDKAIEKVKNEGLVDEILRENLDDIILYSADGVEEK